MRFLLKCIFWLGGVFLLMPGIMGKQADNPALQPQSSRAVQTTPQTQPDQNAPADLVEQWLQAGKTLQEISTFCDRNPAICMAGKATAQQAGEQALLRAKDALGSFSTPAPVAQQQPVQSPATQSVLVRIPVPTPRPR
ncbi:DUF5330 domain-containing protein [Pseudochrobactrum asaccharolyticum]|uniref:Uncharacterized protein n=1 Tax=Pseudochrobactrum asaccharolyticum TaxID=354351 RepID=A0A366EB53_9HYPH|nr:DUF5330 domain-containing protein [Pseudochrobactrum asaccharolyticum]RBO98704.1 hypothetical protein DFR47_101304 [Pseudochrobactrum asaccharolyticum]